MNRSDETAETRHLGRTVLDAERWQEVKKLFETAVSLKGKDRERYLKGAGATDSSLVFEVERLLESFESSDGFLENPAVADAASFFEAKVTSTGRNTTGGSDAGLFVAGTILQSRYRILGLLGRGGMGEVYKAEDIKLSQTVALKFLPDKLQQDAAALERFHAEVRNARQVSHPNVCRVFDISEIDGRHFLSMEYIDGDDLSSLLRRVGRLPSERAIEIARQLCVGLSAIHKAGILHRDFKPANVIIDSNGRARITDFGIAGVEEEISSETFRVGTPAYMSPEQIGGRDVSVRSDIYSLGLLLYEIFTGKQAFSADSIPELIRKQQTETPTNPSDYVKGIDPLVESVIAQCLEKDPADRPASALHVAMALPGGNPMQIALDAGQTPSPEMIAATPKKGVVAPRIAMSAVVLFVGFMLFTTYSNGLYKSYSYIPLQKSPEILAEKVQSMIKSFGYTDRPADVKYRFDFNDSFTKYAAENEAMSNLGERLSTGQPYVMVLTYRQSPQPLEPWYTRRVFFFDPPLTVPGMVNVSTDTTGRLIEFSAVPPALSAVKTDWPPVDWSKFFVEAGLDIKKFETTDPVWTPPVAFDGRSAWNGVMADFADIPIRIEAASFEGKPVYFRVVAPWNKPAEDLHTVTPDNRAGTFIMLGVLTMILVGVIVLVWHNVQTGRADLRGSFRLALFSLAIGLLVSLIQSDHTFAAFTEFSILASILKDVVFLSLVAGLVYCALEPFVRRWWSECLISWSRLLAGDFRDPMVGRDILIGALAAGSHGLIVNLAGLINQFGFGGTNPITNQFWWDATNSFLRSIGVLLQNLQAAVITALSMLTTILIFYFFTRNKKVSLALFGILLFSITFADGTLSAIDYIALALSVILLLATLAKFGLLAMISTMFFARVVLLHPTTFDTTSILFPQSTVVILIVSALVAYAAYISIGQQRLWQGEV
jgi:serine/threonine protein kinase